MPTAPQAIMAKAMHHMVLPALMDWADTAVTARVSSTVHTVVTMTEVDSAWEAQELLDLAPRHL